MVEKIVIETKNGKKTKLVYMNEKLGKSYFVCMSERLSSVVLVKKSFKGKLQFGAEKCVSKLWPYKSKIHIEHEGEGSWF